MDSEARHRLVAETAKLTIDAKPIPLLSDSNDAWKIAELVLRICWRGDRTRLQRGRSSSSTCRARWLMSDSPTPASPMT